jgi:pimeloyl-ACP methyl ester carboxylesterase
MPQFEPAAAGPRIRVPTLVVHDRRDRVNPLSAGQAFAHASRGARLLATDDLGHRTILRDTLVLAQVTAFCS